MKVVDYTLCYCSEDRKMHVGRGCSEEKEKFVGEITNELADVDGYVGEGSVLHLKDFSFATSADLALAVPGGTTISFEGESNIFVINDREDANVGVLYSSGDLTLDGDDSSGFSIHAETGRGLWSRAICARAGDLTINGGKITATAGHAKKSCGVYAGGHLWIGNDNKGKIAINGGSVSVRAGRNAIRAAEGKLTVAAGATVTNAQEFAGAASFVGDCLSPINEELPITVSFLGN